MSQMLYEVRNSSYGSDKICQNLLEILILRIARHQHVIPVPLTSTYMTKECARIKEYLDIHYSEQITLDTLTELTHMNKYYMAHSFAKYTGQSPIQYLNQRRMEAACTLLTDTDHSISSVSSRVKPTEPHALNESPFHHSSMVGWTLTPPRSCPLQTYRLTRSAPTLASTFSPACTFSAQAIPAIATATAAIIVFLILLLFLLSFSNLDYVRYDPPVCTFIHLPASNDSSSRCRRSVTSSTDNSCPVSRAMEVTPLSIKPQG